MRQMTIAVTAYLKSQHGATKPFDFEPNPKLASTVCYDDANVFVCDQNELTIAARVWEHTSHCLPSTMRIRAHPPPSSIPTV